MKPIKCWAAFRNGYLLYESMRGTRAEVRHYIKAFFGINKVYTMALLQIKICKVFITIAR